MKDGLYAVYGASGLGRQIMPLARKQLQKADVDISRLVFVDDKPPSQELNGHKVYSWEEFLAEPAADKYIRSEEHTSELQSRFDLVCRLLLEEKNNIINKIEDKINSNLRTKDD